jgi:LmbE family N-acetylglucosaminyl deacetylase
MLNLGLRRSETEPLSVLCLGAHSDDIEIGCGGTLLHLRELYPKMQLHWIVFSGQGVRGDEARRGAEVFGGQAVTSIDIKSYRDGFLPYLGGEVKEYFEKQKAKVSPDLIFTHWRGDAHQDHRLVCELTWNTFRDHLILEYEIPKYDGDMGRPNTFVRLSTDTATKKVNQLVDTFQSQKTKQWFDRSTFLALMRVRGMESNSPSGYAEAFYCHKLVL